MKTNILIADDEPNQLELMAYNLETSGFGTIKARDGKNALQLIEDHSPDLVILDWMMPNMSGIDLCRTLRSRSETKQLPIIILSARSDDSDKSLGLDTGAPVSNPNDLSESSLLALKIIIGSCLVSDLDLKVLHKSIPDILGIIQSKITKSGE